MKLSRFLTAALSLLWSGALLAANVTQTSQITRTLPLNIGGSFVLENGSGNIEVIGHSEPTMVMTATFVLSAVNQAALTEAKQGTNVGFHGDANTRILRTLVPVLRSNGWSCAVHYSVKVPRTVHVKVTSNGTAERIRVANIIGNVTVKSFQGIVQLDGVSGATIAETVNGSIIFSPTRGPDANAQLSTINGNIVAAVDPEANFEWAAETIRGDFRTTLAGIRARFRDRNSLRAGVNAPGGPTLATTSLMGNIYLLRKGSRTAEAVSVRTGEAIPIPPTRAGLPVYRQEQVQGGLVYSTNLGNIFVREVRGNARLATGAGEVQLGTVYGHVFLNSMGGPLRLGDIFGAVQAHTEAGDVLVNAAREGGTITTGGGNIRVLYTGGPTSLTSGGGDIVVRQAAGPVNADTKSGDITITVHAEAKTQKVTAKTQKGNIILNVAPKFGAEVDATIITSAADSDKITSELAGLQIRRDQVGEKTRIRATGKLNGGGERIELVAEDGGILITSRAGAPVTVITPQ